MCAHAYARACGIDPYILVWVWAHLYRPEKATGQPLLLLPASLP